MIDGEKIVAIPVERVRPRSDQPRMHFDPERLSELSASIREIGQQVPAVVRSLGGGVYEIVDGERRWRACKLAGAKALRAEVRTVRDDDVFLQSVVANFGREGHSPIESVIAVRRVWEMPPYRGMPFMERRERVAGLFARSPSWVDTQRRLGQLPARVVELLGGVNTEHKLHPQVAQLIASIRDDRVQIEVAEEICSHATDRRQALSRVRKAMREHGSREGSTALARFSKPSEVGRSLIKSVAACHRSAAALLDAPARKSREFLDARPDRRKAVLREVDASVAALQAFRAQIVRQT